MELEIKRTPILSAFVVCDEEDLVLFAEDLMDLEDVWMVELQQGLDDRTLALIRECLKCLAAFKFFDGIFNLRFGVETFVDGAIGTSPN